MSIADTDDVRTRVATPIGELELWAQSGTTVLVRAGSELVNRYAQPPETYEPLKLKRGIEVDRVHWHYNRQSDGSWTPYSVGSARRPDGSDLPPTASEQLRDAIIAAIVKLEGETDLLTVAAQLKRDNEARERRAMARRLREIAEQYDAEAGELDAGGTTVYLSGRMPNGSRENWRAVKRADGSYSPGVESLPSEGNYTRRPTHPSMVRDVTEES